MALPAAGVMAALVLAACSREAPEPLPVAAPQAQAVVSSPLDEALARARALDASRDRMQTTPGTFNAGDAKTRYVAYRDSGVLRLVDARSDLGDHGSSAARYYLDATGRLFLYEAQDVRAATDPARAGARETVDVRIVFEAGTRVLAAWKQVDGMPQPVEETEVEAVRERLAALQASASAR